MDPLNRAIDLLFPSSLTDADVGRWMSQGFVFSSFPGTSTFGLVQSRGGPCGVLAVVQSYLLADCLFSATDAVGLEMTDAQREAALVRALVAVLLRCGGGESASIVMLDESAMEEDEEGGAASLSSASGPRPRAERLTVLEADGALGADVCVRAALPQLQSPLGATLFVLSAVMSRGVDAVRGDMDDPDASLTATFGHGTQELMNLLLTGHATGSVHDGTKALGDSGLILRGVLARPHVGYLTYLEAMRYVQVGSHFKKPLLPIWVIGSESHYTVLCAHAHIAGVTVNSVGQELFAATKRTFDACDSESNGFVAQSNVAELAGSHEAALRASCVALHTLATSRGAAAWQRQLGAMRTRLDACATETGGILLWSNFREETAKLLRGEFLQQALQAQVQFAGAAAAGAAAAPTVADQMIVASLVSMGLVQSGCVRAALATANAGVEAATAHYFTHQDDAGFFAAVPGGGGGGGAAAAELSAEEREWRSVLDPADVAASFDTEALVRRCLAHLLSLFILLQCPHRPSLPPPRHRQHTTTIDMLHYNGLSRVVHGESLGPRAVSLSVRTAMGAALVSGRKLDQVLRTVWQGCEVDYGAEAPASIDG